LAKVNRRLCYRPSSAPFSPVRLWTGPLQRRTRDGSSAFTIARNLILVGSGIPGELRFCGDRL